MIDLPQKIVCVGLNYRDHAEEQGVELPDRPLLFAKWPNTLIASGAPIRIPAICKNPDYEAELGVVIGRRASGVPVDDALDFVSGYVVANDVSGEVMGGHRNRVHLITADGVEDWPEASKEDIARRLVARIAQALG